MSTDEVKAFLHTSRMILFPESELLESGRRSTRTDVPDLITQLALRRVPTSRTSGMISLRYVPREVRVEGAVDAR